MMNSTAATATVFLLLLIPMMAMASSNSNSGGGITHIPGFDGPLPFYLESGYVEVDEANGVELFYYFIKSERNPGDDPLILWITGGPGCSAFSGLVFEIGPLKFDVAGYTDGFPTLQYFQDSWTQVSNIIFLDAPVGTGFSYAKVEENYHLSATDDARQLVTFLTKWLADHPEFISNPLYIGGDSYSGYTVPAVALEIANSNAAGNAVALNLKGYLVGNAATDDKYDSQAKVPFLYGMGLISDELYEAAKLYCNGDFVTSSNAECVNSLDAINTCVSGINPVHILEPICGFAMNRDNILVTDFFSSRRFIRENLKLPVECRDNGYRLSYIWADDPEVREILGIHEGSIDSWSRCTTLSHFTHDIPSAIPYHYNLTTRGYRALVYNGDHDLDMTFIGTQAWIKSLNFPIMDDWRPWYSGGQVAGFTRTFANNLTYATVKGGGHTAPEYKPKECLAMVDRWFAGLPL